MSKNDDKNDRGMRVISKFFSFLNNQMDVSPKSGVQKMQ